MTKRVAFITGSASGLGRQMAIALAKEGIHVVLNYVHSQEKAQQTAQLIEEKYGVQVLVLQGDVSQKAAVTEMIAKIRDAFGRLDILVHNAGPFIKEQKKVQEYRLDEWQAMVDGNLNSYFYLLQETLPLMAQNKWGRVVAVGFNQVNTTPAWQYRGAYAAAKSGVASLTKTIALEEAAAGITANVVCPGDIKGSYKEMTIKEAIKNTTPKQTQRVEVGDDVARVVAFLCQENSTFISGSVIEVGGGQDILAKRNRESSN